MFESISGIRLEGAYFSESTDLMLLQKDVTQKDGKLKLGAPRQISLVYGKNGCGKSSISNAIYEYAHGYNQFVNVDFLNNEANLSENKPVMLLNKNGIPIDQIYVFNESFVEDNIQFSGDDQLNAIVMFDAQKELSKKIEHVEEDIVEQSNKVAENEESLKPYTDIKNVCSPLHHKEKVRNSLKENWSMRQMEITGKTHAPVREEFINEILSSTIATADGKIDLLDRFSEKLDIYRRISVAVSITTKVGMDSNLDSEIDTRIEKLLATTIEKPKFNDREKKILEMVNQDHEQVRKAQSFFEGGPADTCPFCFQPIDSDYKTQLLESINRVFDSAAAEKHRKELDSIVLQPISYLLDDFRALDEDLVLEIEGKIEAYNDTIEKTKGEIKLKSEKIYTPILDYRSTLEQQYKGITDALEKLEKKRLIFNENITKSTQLKNELETINKTIASLENKATIQDYRTCLEQERQAQNALEESKELLRKCSEELSRLNAEAANIHLAADIINSYLSYVFCSCDRLVLKEGKGKYSVLSNGCEIKLKDLSTGERNAIALSYFFSTILSNCKKEDFFKKECFVVLDDPISSYDAINKVGIYSLLRYLVKEILCANASSRMIIFTHQIEVMFNLEKVCSDIGKSKVAKSNAGGWILSQKQLSKFSFNKYNDYSFLLQKVYEYATIPEVRSELDDNIGNLMRKILEAFGTFLYKSGIEEISYNEEVLSLIEDLDIREYFRNLMYRLILHNESHLEYQTRGFPGHF